MNTHNKDKDQYAEGSIFENNPFVDNLLDWMGSARGQLSIEVTDTVWCLLEQADVDAKKRKIIWDDGQQLSISESVERIFRQHRQFPIELIETHLIAWLEMDFVPEHFSQEQLDELDILTEKWVNDYYNRVRKE